MKTVFNNYEICHVFCNKVQSEGRTSNGSMFFKNDTLYSYGYHFELAKFIEYNNEIYLFVNTASYSNTTSKHQNHVKRSINESLVKDVFYFDFKNYGSGYGRNSYQFRLDNFFLTDIINELLNESKEHFKSQLKARENTYHYNIGIKKQGEALSLITTFEAILTNSKDLYQNVLNLSDLREQANQKAILIDTNRQERQRIKQEKLAEKEKENLSKWFAGNYNYPLYNLPIYLRLQDNTVQTSHGANVPLDHARHIISLFDKGLDITGKKIGYYTINEVTLDYIKIGCHKMYFNNVNGFIDQHLRA
jgi:hypothetical protein